MARGDGLVSSDEQKDEQKAVRYLKRALVELEDARRRADELQESMVEPIAIIGMSCRLPGGVTSPQELWRLVSAGEEGLGVLPDDRGWDVQALGGAGEAPAFRGGFVDAVNFDADFFGIPPAQAVAMDPQHRLLLESAWEACEDAGIDPTTLRKTDTGVFVGLNVQSYGTCLLGAVHEGSEGFVTAGNAGSMASGRVAGTLGLEGPAVTLDSACSSAGVALHLACQSLRARECSLAMVGGVTVISTPWMYAEFSRQSLFPFSAEHRCKSFADDADGTVFSEGVGVLMLERLSDARRLGHDVLAVVRGSAVNQDGLSNGLTAPNGLAHEHVIQRALTNAGLSAGQIDAIEGHGMGTALGDPIEAQALLCTYGREGAKPTWLGSVKSNIGHTQAASTIAAVIKMVMAMRHELLPKTLHVGAPSRHVDWSSGSLSLLVEPVAWERRDEPRRAAVHALGMSGTNVHIILEEPPSQPGPSASASAPGDVGGDCVGVVPWVLSASDGAALSRQARALAEFVEQHPEHSPADVGLSLACGRARLRNRAVVLGDDRDRMLRSLWSLADGRVEPLVLAAETPVVGDSQLDAVIEAARRSIAEEVSSTARGRWEEMLDSSARWLRGEQVDWGARFAAASARRVRLPTYRFDRVRHWPSASPIWDVGSALSAQTEGGQVSECVSQDVENEIGVG
ncbi:MAG: type I polyketide synthase [Solirubrobacteraceae bacterium]